MPTPTTKSAPLQPTSVRTGAPAAGTRIQRLFIANRGEIARRIATTAGRLGIATVALTDRPVPPAYLADVVTEFVTVDHESPALYLDAAAIIAHAVAAGCDSLHPGFGFLSENAEFAALVLAAGLIWVGPHPGAITGMASKATARDHAEKAGVPCILGLSGFPVPESEQGDFSVLEAFAKKAGLPLLLKAAYGGGGKGMRTVHAWDQLRPAALRAHSEAKNSFGNGALICEQYLTAPRHVEVQILADQHGHVAAIGDRDCSVQRRHQKIIEEAPAPALSAATRKALHEAAVRLAAAVGYDSTGTVEFLVDWSEASRDAPLQPFYFLEMNTRLQVEHPVTEEVYGLDLVEWQLRVAQGEALPAAFTSLKPRGHSVEVRIYAEDVRQNFFPAPGIVAAFKPAQGPGLRWEVGLDEVDEVTGRFDPMIAKLIATGEDRSVALARLAEGLRRTFFAGPPSNIDLLHELATRTAFAEGPVTTHYLLENLPSILAGIDRHLAEHAALGDELLQTLASGALGSSAYASSNAAPTPDSLTQSIFAAGKQSIMRDAGRNPALMALDAYLESGTMGVAARSGLAFYRPVGGKQQAFWYALLRNGSDRHFWVAVAGRHYQRKHAKAELTSHETQQDQTDILAPVPGKVIAVQAAAGDTLAAGATVLVLESMKMEFEVKAARAGQIGRILVQGGEQVAAGQVLATWS